MKCFTVRRTPLFEEAPVGPLPQFAAHPRSSADTLAPWKDAKAPVFPAPLLRLASKARMPLETVTLMFTDLVGSTELAHRVGPGAAEALRQEHFGLLNAGAGEHGRLVKTWATG